jgi:hypothetical protein
MKKNKGVTLLQSMDMRKLGIANPYEYAENHDGLDFDEIVIDFSIDAKTEDQIELL